uniref:FBD domain-containing protein n=1 Tax=Aegilops tauschii subsp. strangulata TaxID=200361 RepID=A0A453MPF8_AEGTS
DGTTFSFKTPPTHLEQVNLELHSTAAKPLRRSMLAATRHARVLKLTAYSMADLASTDLPVFPNLERLEIEELCGWCLSDRAAAVTALFNLLRGCPAVRELRLKFSSREYRRETNHPDPTDQMAAASAMSECSYEGHDDQLSAGPSGATALECLRRSLRRVVVRFDGQLGLTCFQARLIKYFARNAQLLEEVVVDGGRGYDYDASRCVHCKVAGCRPPNPFVVRSEEWFCCCRHRLWAASAILDKLARGRTAPSLWSLSEFPPLGTPAHRRWRRARPADIGGVDMALMRLQRPPRSAASCHRRSTASQGRPNMGRRRR